MWLERDCYLHRIIYNDDAEAMYRTTEEHPTLEYDQNGSPLLCLAAAAYATDSALVLLDNGTDVEVKDEHGHTPLHLAILEMEGTVFSGQCRNRTPSPLERHNYLGIASKSMVHILLEFGAEVDTRDELGNTAVHMAAKGASYDVLDLLMEFGGMHCLLAKNLEGFTPHDIAVAQRDGGEAPPPVDEDEQAELQDGGVRMMEHFPSWFAKHELPSAPEKYEEECLVCDQLERAEERFYQMRQRAFALENRIGRDMCERVFEEGLSIRTNEDSLLEICMRMTTSGLLTFDHYKNSVIRSVLDPDGQIPQEVFDGDPEYRVAR